MTSSIVYPYFSKDKKSIMFCLPLWSGPKLMIDTQHSTINTPCIWMGNPEHGMWILLHSRFLIQIHGFEAGVLSCVEFWELIISLGSVFRTCHQTYDRYLALYTQDSHSTPRIPPLKYIECWVRSAEYPSYKSGAWPMHCVLKIWKLNCSAYASRSVGMFIRNLFVWCSELHFPPFWPGQTKRLWNPKDNIYLLNRV